MTLALVTCTWMRPRLTEAVLRYYTTVDIPGIELVRVVGGGANGVRGWYATNCANSPLGAKWNCAVQEARRFDPDAVMIIGSDNLVSDSWIAMCCEKVAEGYDLISAEQIYMGDMATDRLMLVDRFRTGVGRCWSRSFLDRFEWQLWTDEALHRLDSDFDERLFAQAARGGKGWRQFDAKEIKPHVLIDLKEPPMDASEELNLWTYDEMEAIAQTHSLSLSAREFTQDHFPAFDWPVYEEAI